MALSTADEEAGPAAGPEGTAPDDWDGDTAAAAAAAAAACCWREYCWAAARSPCREVTVCSACWRLTCAAAYWTWKAAAFCRAVLSSALAVTSSPDAWV